MDDTKIPNAIIELAPDGNVTPRQRRHFLIQIAARRVHGGTGSSTEFMHRRTAMAKWPDLREILRDIPWVIVGGVATRSYMPERATNDLDILVHQQDSSEAIRRMQAAGYQVISRLGVPGYLLRSPGGVEVDVIFGKERWLREALSHPTVDVAQYPTIPLPYLILMKLKANRGRDVGDMATMLGLASDAERDEVRRVIAKYSPEDLEDLESLIYLGKKEAEIPLQSGAPPKKRATETKRRRAR